MTKVTRLRPAAVRQIRIRVRCKLISSPSRLPIHQSNTRKLLHFIGSTLEEALRSVEGMPTGLQYGIQVPMTSEEAKEVKMTLEGLDLLGKVFGDLRKGCDDQMTEDEGRKRKGELCLDACTISELDRLVDFIETRSPISGVAV